MKAVFSKWVNAIRAIWRELCHASWFEYALICILAFSALVLLTRYNATDLTNKLPTYLARSFLHGNTYYDVDTSVLRHTLDTALFEGKRYWPGGPMLGLVAIPFTILLGTNFSIVEPRIIIQLLNLFLLFKLGTNLGVKQNTDRLILTLGFVVATNYSGITSGATTYFQQLLTVTFVLGALLAFFPKRNYLLAGISIGAALLTRLSILGLIVFFLAMIVGESNPKRIKIKQTISLLIPILAALGINFAYNFMRFTNWFENGYSYQLIDPVFVDDVRTYGLFNLRYLPANLYYFLLKMPDLVTAPTGNHAVFPYLTRSLWGMSLVITSPMLILAFLPQPPSLLVRWLRITCLTILIPIFLYYGIGWMQYGYRYAIDIYPLLFVLTIMYLNKQLNRQALYLITLGTLATWWFLIIAPAFLS